MRAILRCALVVWLSIAAVPVTVAAPAAIGHYGFDETGVDPAVRPGDDFDGYASGAWRRRTVMPADHSYWGVWDILEEQAGSDVRDLLEASAREPAAPGSSRRKLADFYASYMDEATIERRGAAPLKPQLAAIAAIRDYHDLARAFGRAMYAGDSMPVVVSVSADLKSPDVNVAYLEQGGLGLPDRDYYLADTQAMAIARQAYLGYTNSLLRLAGVAGVRDAPARARAVLALERRLAQVHWSREQLRDPAARYDVWPAADLAQRAPGLDWPAFLAAAGVGGEARVIASTNSAIAATAALVPDVPLAVWRDYLVVRAVDGHAPFLSRAFVREHFALHRRVLDGTPEQSARWRRGARYTQRAMGEAVGEVYVERHFSAAAKAAALELVHNLLAATARRLQAVDWMSAPTRARALEKVARMTVKVGYPDHWRDYSGLVVVRGRAYENALAAERFEYERNLAKLGVPVDRGEWQMAPMDVNAYYDPTRNEIVFPAAVLQPPFFDPNADPAVNYGGIGSIIGHEISHGFDDEGRQFDASGALSDWWTPQDAADYRRRTDALVAQYAGYEVLPGVMLNAQLTLGENIADNAGLVLAYEAYVASPAAQGAPVIDGRSGGQRFFLAYAQNWRTLFREEALRQLMTTDPHTPDALRVRAVRNCDAWYAAFAVPADAALYLAPDARVRIW